MIRTITSRLATLAACVALAFGTAAPTTAYAEQEPQEGQMSENTAGLLFFGLAAAALIAHLNTRNDDKDDDRAAPPSDRIDRRTVEPRIEVPRADPRAIPIHCLKRAQTREGPVRLYMRHCLHMAGVPVLQLPEACEQRLQGPGGGISRGFVPRCLDQHGYYMPQAR